MNQRAHVHRSCPAVPTAPARLQAGAQTRATHCHGCCEHSSRTDAHCQSTLASAADGARCCTPSKRRLRVARLAAVAAAYCLAACQQATAASGPVDSSTYQPGPVDVGWQVYVGALIAVVPFIIGAYEFGKRILIQRRCQACGGSGLVMRGGKQRKCLQCGGMFPWRSWQEFFSSASSPGNGGPLLQPRGQKGMLYKVPGKGAKPAEQGNGSSSSVDTNAQ